MHQSFGRTLHVGLDDERKGLDFALAHIGKHVFELLSLLTGELDFAVLALTEESHFTGLAFVGHHKQFVAGGGHVGQTLDFHRDGRTGRGDLAAQFVDHRSHTAEALAGQNDVALLQQTGLNQNGSHRTAALVESAFDHETLGRALVCGLEFEHFGLQQHVFKEVVDALAGLGGHRAERHVAAVFFRQHFVLHEFALDAFNVGFGLVDLVDRHHKRNTGGTSVRNGFLGLGHHAVVGGHHQNHDVGCLSTAGSHGRKGFVARSVEEGHDAARGLDVVGTDVLGNAAGFACSHLGTTDVVKQRCLTVVNVTHDGHDRRTRHFRILFQVAFEFAQQRFRIVGLGGKCLVAHFLDDDHRRFLVEHLVDRHHLAHLHEGLDDFGRLHAHLVSQIGHRDRFGNGHFTHHGLGRHLNLTLFVLVALATAAVPAARLVAVNRTAGLHAAATSAAVFVAPAIVALGSLLTALAVCLAFVLFGLVGSGLLSLLVLLSGLLLRILRLSLLGLFIAVGLVTAVSLGLENGLRLGKHRADGFGFFLSLATGFLTASFEFGLLGGSFFGSSLFSSRFLGSFSFALSLLFCLSLSLTGLLSSSLFSGGLFGSKLVGFGLTSGGFRRGLFSGSLFGSGLFFGRLLSSGFLSSLLGCFFGSELCFGFALGGLGGFSLLLFLEFAIELSLGLRFDFGTHRFGGAVLHKHAAATHFDLNRAGSALAVVLTNGARFATRHGDLAGSGHAFLTQAVEKLTLVGVADFVVDSLHLNACSLKLG